MAWSSVSLATSATDFGVSTIIHFTFPARISSWAMRQGLRELVSTTGGAPLWSWRARRAAARVYREFLSEPSINFILFFPQLTSGFVPYLLRRERTPRSAESAPA